jgi:hypothetical protein
LIGAITTFVSASTVYCVTCNPTISNDRRACGGISRGVGNIGGVERRLADERDLRCGVNERPPVGIHIEIGDKLASQFMSGDLVDQIELASEPRDLCIPGSGDKGFNLRGGVKLRQCAGKLAKRSVADSRIGSLIYPGLEDCDRLVVVVYKDSINALIAGLITHGVDGLDRLKAILVFEISNKKSGGIGTPSRPMLRKQVQNYGMVNINHRLGQHGAR